DYRSFFRSFCLERNSCTRRSEVMLNTDVLISLKYRERVSLPSLSLKLHEVCVKCAPIAFVTVELLHWRPGYLSLTAETTKSKSLGEKKKLNPSSFPSWKSGRNNEYLPWTPAIVKSRAGRGPIFATTSSSVIPKRRPLISITSWARTVN